MEYIAKISILDKQSSLRIKVKADSKTETIEKICKEYNLKKEDVKMVRQKGAVGFVKWFLKELKENEGKHAFKKVD